MTLNLRDYAARIAAYAEKLQTYLDSQNEKIGFDASSRPARLFPQELQESRVALMSACMDLSDVVEGADASMTMLPFQAVHDIGALKILYHYQLWKLVPEQGSASYADIAKATNLEIHRLYNYIRHLISRRIFLEPEPGRVAHSTASLYIAKNEALQCWIAACTDDIAEAVQALPETYDEHGRSDNPNYSPFNHARKDTTVNGMSVVLSDKHRGPRYAKGLGWLSQCQMGDNEAILDAYPWGTYGLVVDVGGGSGHFSVSLARRFPQSHCVIQDIAAQASYFKVPKDVEGRVEYQVHDIFKPQPVQADIYVLRIVLHCFSDDEQAASILRNILPAMKRASRIILIDLNLDPACPTAWARVQSCINSSMHTLGGKDRTAEDWAAVIKLAGPELQLGNIISPPGKWWSAIEVLRMDSK